MEQLKKEEVIKDCMYGVDIDWVIKEDGSLVYPRTYHS